MERFGRRVSVGRGKDPCGLERLGRRGVSRSVYVSHGSAGMVRWVAFGQGRFVRLRQAWYRWAR